MKEQEFVILWQKIKAKTAKLLRVYAKEPELMLPETIEGCLLTEIAPYCFAKAEHLPESEILVTKVAVMCENDEVYIIEEKRVTDENMRQTAEKFRVFCGDYVKKISLPLSVIAVGNLAFYNCVNLEELSIGKAMQEVGSDAFMNCRSLSTLLVHGNVRERSFVQQILSQISSGIEVVFCEKTKQVKIFYPEYQEFYDEIVPAHIFRRKMEGEGFRARQSFTDGVVDLARYDLIFPRACVEENEDTLLHLAMDRLLYPVDLKKAAQLLYENYVKEHAEALMKKLIKAHALFEIGFLCEKQYVSEDVMEKAIAVATDCEWAEGVASLLEWKRKFFQKEGKDRYTFDEF